MYMYKKNHGPCQKKEGAIVHKQITNMYNLLDVHHHVYEEIIQINCCHACTDFFDYRHTIELALTLLPLHSSYNV